MPQGHGNRGGEYAIAGPWCLTVAINIDLSGKTALITGATRGIGKAIAEKFIEAGATVFLTGTNEADIKQLTCTNKNPNVHWLQADFSTRQGIDSLIAKLKCIDRIDICINNAGINTIKPFEDYSKDEYERLLSVNLTAPFSLAQYLVIGMKERSFGRVVNVASIWSLITKPERALYTTSKTGMLGFTRALAVEYAPWNILVNAVSPGFTCTELTKQSLSVDEMKVLSTQIPLQRFANPDEIAMAVLFLCSDLNSYITGQNIVIDGGYTLV
ncbi:MAG TPA: SDR family oxidoreductase [Flavobacteriales bacterium]|nr:SDR family oxidoreductase [Flavobacteriales bacterium]